MLSKKIIKKIFTLMFLLLVISLPIYSLAVDVQSSLGDLNNYGKITGDSKVFEESVGKILSIVQVVASLAAVICLVILGVKYMTGSIEEKAQYKKTLMPYFIGAMMVFRISNFLVVIYNVAIAIF